MPVVCSRVSSCIVIDSHVAPAYGSTVNHSSLTLHARWCSLALNPTRRDAPATRDYASPRSYRTINRSCARDTGISPVCRGLSRSAPGCPWHTPKIGWSTCSSTPTVSPALADATVTPLATSTTLLPFACKRDRLIPANRHGDLRQFHSFVPQGSQTLGRHRACVLLCLRDGVSFQNCIS